MLVSPYGMLFLISVKGRIAFNSAKQSGGVDISTGPYMEGRDPWFSYVNPIGAVLEENICEKEHVTGACDVSCDPEASMHGLCTQTEKYERGTWQCEQLQGFTMVAPSDKAKVLCISTWQKCLYGNLKTYIDSAGRFLGYCVCSPGFFLVNGTCTEISWWYAKPDYLNNWNLIAIFASFGVLDIILVVIFVFAVWRVNQRHSLGYRALSVNV